MDDTSSLRERLVAIVGDRYVVEREIGSGGMAIVFAARDVRHHRLVAIKVLRPELAASLGPERFLREIELAAGLQHPHILPVFDSGAAHGVFYYVMPFVEGESLAARIAHDGALPLDDAVRIGTEVAGALAYAHARGIVHRDIKPDNILLSNGHALVTDFGVARAMGSLRGPFVGAERLTATGMAVGTPIYMSPEQALGSSDIDGRSDVYSLGCVLYEMLTGAQPFAADSLQGIIAQSINAPRPRPRRLRREISPALDAAVVTALAAEPSERQPGAEALQSQLRSVSSAQGGGRRRHSSAWIAAGACALALAAIGALAAWRLQSRESFRSGPAASVTPGARVIAVLPFTSAGAQNASLSEGMVDLIATNLDGVGGIRVIDPHASVRRWSTGAAGGDRASALRAARDLGAQAVLLGDIVALGGRIRVVADLLDVNGAPLARTQGDAPPDSLLGLVDTLSMRLLRDIWRSASPMPELRVSALTTGSFDALRAYLDGEQRLRRSDWTGAAKSYGRAIELDSTFAVAYLRLLKAQEWMATPPAAMHATAALVRRRLDRLSPRDRSLAIGDLLYHDGDLAAYDSALALTVRYPDAMDAWVLLGEMRYHAAPFLAPSPEEIRAPFERVLAIDSTLAAPFTHILETDAMFADTARFARDLSRLRRSVPSADTVLAVYDHVAAVAWGDDAAADAALPSLVGHDTYLLSVVAEASLAAGTAARFARLVARLAASSAPSANTEAAQRHGLYVLVATAQLAAAQSTAARMLAVNPGEEQALALRWRPMLVGMDDSTAAFTALRSTTRDLAGKGVGFLAGEELAVATKDSGLLLRTMRQSLNRDTVTLPIALHALFEAPRGWLTMALGDTTRGLLQLDTALAHSPFPFFSSVTMPRFMRAVALSRRNRSRAEGIRELRYAFEQDPWLFGVRHLALAQALAASGNRAAADSARAVAARTLRAADASARDGLQRFYASPSNVSRR